MLPQDGLNLDDTSPVVPALKGAYRHITYTNRQQTRRYWIGWLLGLEMSAFRSSDMGLPMDWSNGGIGPSNHLR